MKVNIEDVLFWMDAIRNCEDRYRTLESFWKGQVHSKLWLIENLERSCKEQDNEIEIHGGWNGVLAALLFNSNLSVKKITSIDIDPECKEISETINKRYEMAGRFTSETFDMCKWVSNSDIVINTSCEHLTQEQYDTWLSNINNEKSLIVLQSNNYFDHKEHIRCSHNLQEFIETSHLRILWSGELEFSKYTRFMIIGYKNV